jgi:serine/threonine-protein kinase
MCDGSHEDGATCPAYASKRRDEAPTATDAESLVIEMKSSPAAPMGPGSMLGQFKLIQEIAAGGMGRVFRALDTVLDRPVAIKLIHPDFLMGNKQAGDRFISEARLTARIRHRNVVPVYHLGTDTRGNPFLVMELLQGKTLTAALEAKERFPLSRIVSIGKQVLSALAEAHEHLVHRDLKPGNIFLTPDADGEELVTVLDFGIAKALKDAGPT